MFSRRAFVHRYQVFAIGKRRKRAAPLRVMGCSCALRVISYVLLGKREETRQKKDCDY
jgi:hypothetical protein